MSTVRQRKLAKVIIENSTLDKPLNGGQMVEKVGYAKSLVDYPKKVIDTEGVQEALEEYGFTIENAKMVVSEIMLNSDVDPSARLKATDQVFKVKDGYAATKSVNINIGISEEARERSKQAIKQFLDDRGDTI